MPDLEVVTGGVARMGHPPLALARLSELRSGGRALVGPYGAGNEGGRQGGG
jgi:hypothetical protein